MPDSYNPFIASYDPDAYDLPQQAAECDDFALAVERELGELRRVSEDIESAISNKRDDLRLCADSYTRHHKDEWRAIMIEASKIGDALLALQKRVRAA